jgi:hypothetical protein
MRSRIQERQRYLEMLDAIFQLQEAQIRLLRQTGELEGWVQSAAVFGHKGGPDESATLELIAEDGVDVVAVADDDGRPDEQGEATGDQQLGAQAGAVPLLEDEAPEGGEDYDRRHMQGPGGEVVLAHLGLAHRIEEELKVPDDASHSLKAHQITQYHNAAPRFNSNPGS